MVVPKHNFETLKYVSKCSWSFMELAFSFFFPNQQIYEQNKTPMELPESSTKVIPKCKDIIYKKNFFFSFLWDCILGNFPQITCNERSANRFL